MNKRICMCIYVDTQHTHAHTHLFFLSQIRPMLFFSIQSSNEDVEYHDLLFSILLPYSSIIIIIVTTMLIIASVYCAIILYQTLKAL